MGFEPRRAAGSGVRVAGKKTYVIRRKVDGVSIMPAVGNVADFLDLGLARKKAAELARLMVETGKNPNKTKREAGALEPTLGAVIAAYRSHLATRVKRRASAETLRAVDRAVNKFTEWNWAPRKLEELRSDEIIEQFHKGASTPTATEQTFRLASTAPKWAIGKEMLDAAHEGRSPALTVNPFTILMAMKKMCLLWVAVDLNMLCHLVVCSGSTCDGFLQMRIRSLAL